MTEREPREKPSEMEPTPPDPLVVENKRLRAAIAPFALAWESGNFYNGIDRDMLTIIGLTPKHLHDLADATLDGKEYEKSKDGCTCQGCGEKFSIDLNIPDHLWKRIKPRDSSDEGGLLCGACIMARLEELQQTENISITMEAKEI